jgi:hypothetical protein
VIKSNALFKQLVRQKKKTPDTPSISSSKFRVFSSLYIAPPFFFHLILLIQQTVPYNMTEEEELRAKIRQLQGKYRRPGG